MPELPTFTTAVATEAAFYLRSCLIRGYYILVFKCFLNWHLVDHARPFFLSSQGTEDPFELRSTPSEPRGLEEAVIMLLPVIRYKPEDFGERATTECSVCLSEFQQDEKLRVIPNCGHVFHIDCIDIWLHNNAHCPLCRTSVSSMTSQVHVDQVQVLTPRPSPQDQSQNIENLIDEGFVVIDLESEHEHEHDRDQNLQGRQEELETCSIGVSSQRGLSEEKIARKHQKVTSLGDECIDVRGKDEGFSAQDMRRSFSMDSSVDRQFYGPDQQALRLQNGHVNEVNTIDGRGGSGRVKRSFFSFGHGSRSRNAVLPVYSEP
ncbi:hypothetical protein Fmac_024814 [Flemingia macrophylla]|uniref:RING-type E3 ubiquitin transferase n=1 Tax=Flemingia macrophylla TaxID=520843 RepID=A0ABD1LQF6_9FABA